jgi:hypothetical protein
MPFSPEWSQAASLPAVVAVHEPCNKSLAQLMQRKPVFDEVIGGTLRIGLFWRMRKSVLLL